MSRCLTRLALIIPAVSVLIGFPLLPCSPCVPEAQAQTPDPRYFDVGTQYAPGQGWAIPPPGTIWWELSPGFFEPHSQSSYVDNGDGVVSATDCIVEEVVNARWQVTKVTTSYILYETTRVESELPPAPVVLPQTWTHVPPTAGPPEEVTNWRDNNQNAALDADDDILIGGNWRHVSVARCGATVEWSPTTPARPSTWGRMKCLYRR
jgi:hypothetical protein